MNVGSYEYNRATINRPEGTRPVDGPVLSTDLPKALAALRAEESYQRTSRNGISLVHGDVLRVVLVAFHDGAAIPEETIEGALLIHVLEGNIRLKAADIDLQLGVGSIASIAPGTVHSLQASGETAVLMTITKDQPMTMVPPYAMHPIV
jgi:quercetin dioxygenase-like cupin family protein